MISISPKSAAMHMSCSHSFGSSSKHAEIGPESFGIVVCRSAGTVRGNVGLVWPSFGSKSGPEIEDSRPDPLKFSRPFKLSRDEL